MYLVIKRMSTMADDVIIVTSSLTKDMTGKCEEFRAGAIKALRSRKEVERVSRRARRGVLRILMVLEG